MTVLKSEFVVIYVYHGEVFEFFVEQTHYIRCRHNNHAKSACIAACRVNRTDSFGGCMKQAVAVNRANCRVGKRPSYRSAACDIAA